MESTKGGLRTLFFSAVPFLGSKMGFEMVSSTLKKIIKNHLEKPLVETIACQTSCQTKNDEEICAPNKYINMRRIKKTLHRSKQHCKDHSVILHNIFRWVAATDGLVISYLRSQVFACNPCILCCQTIKVYPNTNASRMFPKSPFSNEFSFGLVPFPVRLFNFIQTCPTN